MASKKASKGPTCAFYVSYGCEKVENKLWFTSIQISKTLHLQKLKGHKETRYVNGVPLSKGGNTKRVPFLAKMVYKMLRGRTLGRSLRVWNLPPGREHSLCDLACPRFLFSFSQPLWLEAIKKRKGFFCSFLGMESGKLWVTSQFVEYKVFLNYSRESQTKNRVQNELFLRILGVTLWWTTHRLPISSSLYHMEMTGVLLSPFWGTGGVDDDGVVAVPFRQM